MLDHAREYDIEGEPLGSVTVYKDLGLLTASDLSWNQHVDNIAKIRQYLSFDTAKTLVDALVLSKIDNCSSLLYGAPKHLVVKLQNVQNATARIIVTLGKHDNITPVLKELHWLPVELRIVYKIYCLVFMD